MTVHQYVTYINEIKSCLVQFLAKDDRIPQNMLPDYKVMAYWRLSYPTSSRENFLGGVLTSSLMNKQ
eukprot:4726918-Ditylum_brightwellii.AAC.1